MSTKKELRANIGNFHDCGKYGIIQSGGREAAAGKRSIRAACFLGNSISFAGATEQ